MAVAAAVAVAFGSLPTEVGDRDHDRDRGELQPTSSRSAWTEDSVETEDGRATVAAGLSPLSAALRVLHLRRARAGEAGGLTASQRALARDLALHEDLASIVTSVTRCPVGDDSKPGMLCQLSLKTRASLMEEGGERSGEGHLRGQQVQVGGLAPRQQPALGSPHTVAGPGTRPTHGPHSGSSGRATSPPLGGPSSSGVGQREGQGLSEAPRVLIPPGPRPPVVPVFEAQPLIGRCEVRQGK